MLMKSRFGIYRPTWPLIYRIITNFHLEEPLSRYLWKIFYVSLKDMLPFNTNSFTAQYLK